MESTFQHADRTYQAMKRNLLEHVRGMFPVEGKKQKIELKSLEIKDNLDPGDYASQKRARLNGKSWSVPMVAQMVLKDESGKVVDRSKMKLLSVPRLTSRGSYIVGGTEYMFPIQKRLKPGPYVTSGETQDLRTFFNMGKGRNFHLGIHPTKGHFQFQIESSKNIPLYPVLKALGAKDDQMVRSWGQEVYKNNRVDDAAVSTKALKKVFEKMSYGEDPPADFTELQKAIKDIFDGTEMDGKNSEVTLGKNIDRANAESMILASAKMLRVSRGDEKEDNRDSLVHNDMVDLSDFIVERFKDYQFRNRIERSIKFNIDRRDQLSQIISKDSFQRPIDSLMTESQVSRTPNQTNPLGLISDYTAVTVRGEGGIQTDNALTRSLRALDPSHLSFLDPAHTPEGSGVGTTLHLTVNTKKDGKSIVSRFMNIKTGKVVELNPLQVYNSRVAFPEYLKDNKLSPKNGKVKISHKGEISTVAPSKVEYAIIGAGDLIDVNTATIPFTNHNNGARVMLASKMGVQAKPLAEREAPLVQVGVPGERGTAERAVGTAFSPKSPVDGTVEKITDDYITISGKKVSIPNYFPLNSNNFVHATPTVEIGDKVKKDQVIADTNYTTKKGDLAIGKNLSVAYIPYKGMNVEDGVVISEGAAEKMTSEHLYQQSYPHDSDTVINLKKFRSYFPAKITEDQAKTLDESGIIKKGQKVEKGSILVAAMRRSTQGTESQRMASISRILAKEFRDDSLIWGKEADGEVMDVAVRAKEIVVNIRTKEKMKIGDKLVGRYANKGIVGKIIPDDEMPQDEKGNSIDLILNPNGVVSRMNIGQIMETTASKIAEKTGKPYVSQSFGGPDIDQIQKDLKKHGLKDHETIYDPKENAKIPGVLVGKQYIYKLEHQATKKITARGGGVGESYTSENQPGRGQGVGGRAIGNMELYALLAHGSLKNIHEMYGVKSNFDPEVWRAIENGSQLPPPRASFSQEKFTSLLKAMGVNVERRGNEMAMVPFLDRDMKDISNGEVKNFKLIRGKDLKEEKDGLFDPKKTGGVQGDRWTHIKLPEPIPNPTFEKAVLGLLHMKKPEFDAIMSGEKKVGALTGGMAIKHLLSQIDVSKRLVAAKKEAVGKRGSELNALHKEIRYLKVLKENKIKPQEYVIEKLPVLPPKFRPIYPLPDGNLRVSDLNFHYASTMQISDQMKAMKGKEFDEPKRKLAKDLYKSVGGIMGLNEGVVERKDVKGVATILGGRSGPKSGYIHSRILKKRQDVSATSVIVANPKLHMDEIGLPEESAWKTFKPFLVKELRSMGMTPLQAREAVEKRDHRARQALERVVKKKNVILNRAPTLHKFSVMAFKPKLVSGYAIQIPPLVVGGFNADFDGDTMAVHVPISEEANEEAGKMLPSKHLYKPGSKKLQPKIEHEYVLGLFKISRPGPVSAKRYQSAGQVVSDLRSRKIPPDARISITGIGSTTPGRVLINQSIPKRLRDYGLIFTSKAITAKLVEIDKKEGRDAFVKALHDFADIGRRYAYVTGSSFLLSDLQTMTKQRNDMYRIADKQADRIRMGPGTKEEKEKKIISLYTTAGDKLKKGISLKKNSSKKSNNIMDMMVAGARGNPNQVKQMVSSIGVMLDHRNKAMAEPVRGTYAEGLESSEFFQHMYGNRKGMIDRSQSVRDPGALTKQVIVSAAGYRVSMIDCRTKNGIMEPTSGTSALDRYSAENISGVIKKDQLVTTSSLSGARGKNVKSIKVRSPLSCEAPQGVCVKCYGLDEEGKPAGIGDHVGIKDSQGLTEPSTQLAMKTFHTGGVVTGKTNLATGFDRVKQLFTMPNEIRDKASLSEIGGTVQSISVSPYGGSVVTIDGKKHKTARGRKVTVRVGQRVSKGEKITDGNIQPQDMLRLNGLRSMQRQLRDDIQGVYSSAGEHISAKSIEAPVKILTENVRITDPGDHPSLVSGDYGSYTQVDSWNRSNPTKKPVRYEHQLPGAETLPHRTDDWAKRMAHNRIQQVLTEAPAMGAKTKIKGDSPFSTVMFEERIPRHPGGVTSG